MIYILICLGFLLGTVVNYLTDTLPWKRKISRPFCIHCQAEMSFKNYFLFPRLCSNCGRRRDLLVGLVELICMVVVPLLWYLPPKLLGAGWAIVIFAYFCLITIIDLRYKLILHTTSLIGIVIAFVAGLQINGLNQTILGGVAGFGVMFVLYKLGEIFIWFLKKRRGKLEDEVALGFGDVNLSGVIGLMVGFPGVIVSLFMSAIVGGAISFLYLAIMLLRGKYRTLTALPYGPFLIFGAISVLYFTDLLAKLFK